MVKLVIFNISVKRICVNYDVCIDIIFWISVFISGEEKNFI